MNTRHSILSYIGSFCLSFLVALAAISPVQAQDCGFPEGDPPASLSWLEIADDASSAQADQLTLTVSNDGPVVADINVFVTADFGGSKHRTRRFRIRDLPAGDRENVIVDIARLKPPKEMAYAGQIFAVAEVEAEGNCEGRDCKPLRENPDDEEDVDADGVPTGAAASTESVEIGAELIVSPSLYFHRSPDSDAFEVYGAEILAGRHNGGDLSGSLEIDEPELQIVRVNDIGRGLRNGSKGADELAIDALPSELGNIPADDLGVASDEYGLCIRWQVQITELGRKLKQSNGTIITEDFWHGHSKAGGKGFLTSGLPKDTGKMIVTARGPRVMVKKGDWSFTTNAHPKTGCFTFSAPVDGPFSLFVYGEHHDAFGNKTVVRNKNGNRVAWLTTVNPQKGKNRTALVGNFGGNATLAAMSGFGLYRSAMGLTDKTIDLRPTNTCGKSKGNNTSAHFRFDGLEDGIAYLRFNDGTGVGSTDGEPCTKSDLRRAKFVVMHEMGHAMMLLRTKTDEPNVPLGLVRDDEVICSQGSAYTPTSLEHSSVGAREGMAHFYAAIVWNRTSSSTGVFSFFGTGRNLETYTAEKGGRLWNKCNTVNKCGTSVIMDWARFWWDIHTPYKPGKPTIETIARIYGRNIANGGLTKSNYYEKTREAMEQEIADVQVQENFHAYAEWNGIDTSPSGAHCLAPYPYTECGSNPAELGAGEIGCPCADVLPLNLNNAHLVDTDGYYPDGAGSYAETGSAQYCQDAGEQAVVCGLAPHGFGGAVAPVCQACGIDTMVGCACDNDEQCDTELDDQVLSCHGATANGWLGSSPGTCLPSASSTEGREDLTAMPWFCLDNCGSKGSNYACIYDQFDGTYDNDHGRCSETVVCDAPAGWCESGSGMCELEASCPGDWDDCCVAECSSNAECDLLGFPGSYSCDTGSCVPAGCEGDFGSFCSLYR